MTKYDTETEAESYEAAHLARIALDAAMEAVDHYQRRHGVCDAPFRVTLHVDNGNEADREGTFPPITTKEEAREVGRDALRRAGEAHDRYTGRDGWIRHDGGECPVHPMDVVQVDYGRLAAAPRGFKEKPVRTAYQPAWSRVEYYRPLRDEGGVPYCSAEGLEDWAEYVATDESGEVWQYSIRPVIKHAGKWDAYTCNKRRAPDCYASGDNWTQTLRRVYRREDT